MRPIARALSAARQHVAGAAAIVAMALVPMAPAPMGLAAIALAAPIAACARHETGGPALWRVTDKDSTVYLFGTVHVLPPELKWRSKRVDAAFRASDLVYFETETDAAAQEQVNTLIRRYGLNPAGVTLTSQLAPADRVRLVRVADQLQLPIGALEPAKPWLAALQLSVAFIVSEGQAADAGVERVLEQDARRQGKKRAYFESAEEQIRFFADLPNEVGVEFLSATLRQIEEEADLVTAMDQAWVEGDVERLGALLNGLLEETGPEVYDALIVKRNAAWAEELERVLAGKGTVFVAVGAAHLAGKDSLAEMLRAKGYKVEGP